MRTGKLLKLSGAVKGPYRRRRLAACGSCRMERLTENMTSGMKAELLDRIASLWKAHKENARLHSELRAALDKAVEEGE